MDSVVCHYTGGNIDEHGTITGDGYCGHSKIYILLLTLPALPICWIKTYTMLSYFSMVGIALAIVGMIIMFGMLGDKTA